MKSIQPTGNISTFLEAFKNQSVDTNSLKNFITNNTSINKDLINHQFSSSLYVYAIQNYDLDLLRFLIDNNITLGLSASYHTSNILVWEVFYQEGRSGNDDFSLQGLETNDDHIIHQIFAILMCGAIIYMVDDFFDEDEIDELKDIPLLRFHSALKIKYNKQYIQFDKPSNLHYSYLIDRLTWIVSHFSITNNEFAPGANQDNITSIYGLARIHSHIYDNIKDSIYNLTHTKNSFNKKVRQQTTKNAVMPYLNRNTASIISSYINHNNINGARRTKRVKKLRKNKKTRKNTRTK